MPQTFVLEDVVVSALDTALQGVWTAMPGRIETYDATLQRANIQLTVKSGSIGEDGERDVQTIAVINAVPVLHAGGGNYRLTMPVQRGDTVLVVFASRSIDAWLRSGGVVDPQTDHHHDISDAIAITGLRDFAHPLSGVSTDHASIGYGGGATIEFHPSEVRLGDDSASSAVVVQAALADFMTALTLAIPGAGTAAAALTSLQTQLNALNASAGWKARTSKVKAV
jgi:hypothetical protein